MANTRILPASNNPYASGAVILDSTPYTQFYLNKQAREEANQNAFYKTFHDIGNNINAAGLANEDIPSLYKKKADWQNFVLSHNKEYMNPSLDNGAAYGEANRLYNDAAAHIANGKAKVANLAKASTILSDPEKSALLTEAAHQNLERARLPIDNPNYQAWNTDNIFNPKPFDLKEQNSLRQDLGGTFKGTQISDVGKNALEKADPNTYKINRHYNTQYDNSDLLGMRGQAENLYHNNKGFTQMINTEMNNPDRVKQMDEIYGQHFKNDNGQPLHIEHPEDFTTAYLINQNPNTGHKIKEEIDEGAKYNDWKRKFDLEQSAINARQKNSFEHQDKMADSGANAVDEFIQNTRSGKPFGGKEGERLEKLNVSPIVANEYKKDGIAPAIGRTPDGKIYAVYGYQKDASGKTSDIPDWTKTVEIPDMTFKSTIVNKALSSNYKTNSLKGSAPKTKVGKKKINGF